MAWNGSGTFSRTNGDNTGSTTWQQDKADGDKITASRHDEHDQDLADGINNCLAKDGQNSMTANLNMGGFSITNYGSGGVTLPEVSSGTYLPTFASTGGTFTYLSQGGEYITIGDMVVCNVEITASLSGSHTGTLRVELPFTASLVTNGSASIGNYVGLTVEQGVYGLISAAGNICEIRVGADASTSSSGLDMSDVGTTVQIVLTATYIKS